MDIADWLRGLGLDRYEAAFRDNAIEADILADLTVADLAELGVNLGDRKRLLKAIASLGLGPSAGAAARPVPRSGRDAAERRPITVLFCDLVGSTSLAAKLDAEDWRNLVEAYLDAASEAVAYFGGHVQDRLGDGLMALFGYPQAHENDAERAVRAALGIQRALDALNVTNASRGDPQLAARVGLESGQVVVDATGAVFGEAPNVASRVQSLAEPGAVLVTGAVQRQIAGLFVAEDRGSHELRGVPEPVSLYRISRVSSLARRSGGRALTPLVGREAELSLLNRAWEQARAGDGRFVLLSGEPGIGKSRLLQEFRARLGATPYTWVEWSASQLLQNTPLHPIVEWGRLRFGGADASDEQRLADLEAATRLVGLDEADQAALGALLVDGPLTDGRRTRFAPDALRRRQLTAIVAWLLAAARIQPVVVAFEDLQWADPTTLDLMKAIAEQDAKSPLLVIATARPEFRPAWSADGRHSLVSLAALEHADVLRMVSELASRHALADEVVEGVSERSGGVPLFVEEVTRLLLERRVEGVVPTIPPTLQQSLASRLDSLGSGREIAQIAAVLGRDFPYGLLRSIADLEEAELRSALDRLAEADILFPDAGGSGAYRFKHALIQDAAYESLLRSRRRTLHRRAAEILSGSPERALAEPEAIARHFTEAGLDDLAVEWWGRAGDQALRRSAFQEAIAHLGKAIGLANRAASRNPAAAASPLLPRLHVAYGNALIAARGYGAPETTEAFAKAHASASEGKDATESLAAAYGLWLGGYVRGELPAMKTHAEAFLGQVAMRPGSPEVAVGRRIAGITGWFAGRYREARDDFEEALAVFQPGRDDDLAFRFGFDPGVGAMGYLASALWPLGEVDRAVSLIRQMERRAADLAHIGTRAFATLHAALFELMRGDPACVEPGASALGRLAQEHKLTFHSVAAAFLDGWVKARRGDGGGLEQMRRAFEAVRAQKILSFLDLGSMALADAETRAGDPGRALAYLDEALATDAAAGSQAFTAELHRTRGDILRRGGLDGMEGAEAAFRAAIDVARRQGVRSFELRAALGLARVLAETGRVHEKQTLLASVLDGLSPTPAFPEIAHACELLAWQDLRDTA